MNAPETHLNRAALAQTTHCQFTSVAQLHERVGQEVALSDWVEITQERINQFAQATGDFQWIHVDAQRAAQGPFGSTIAHGFLTLSLVAKLFGDSVTFPKVRFALNYGVNKVRFTAPVPVGSRLRARIALFEAAQLGAEQQNALQTVWNVIIERDSPSADAPKPVCVAQTVIRVYE